MSSQKIMKNETKTTRIRIPRNVPEEDRAEYLSICHQIEETGGDPKKVNGLIRGFIDLSRRIDCLRQQETDGGGLDVTRALTTATSEHRRLIEAIFQKKKQNRTADDDPTPEPFTPEQIAAIKTAHAEFYCGKKHFGPHSMASICWLFDVQPNLAADASFAEALSNIPYICGLPWPPACELISAKYRGDAFRAEYSKKLRKMIDAVLESETTTNGEKK